MRKASSKICQQYCATNSKAFKTSLGLLCQSVSVFLPNFSNLIYVPMCLTIPLFKSPGYAVTPTSTWMFVSVIRVLLFSKVLGKHRKIEKENRQEVYIVLHCPPSLKYWYWLSLLLILLFKIIQILSFPFLLLFSELFSYSSWIIFIIGRKIYFNNNNIQKKILGELMGSNGNSKQKPTQHKGKNVGEWDKKMCVCHENVHTIHASVA